MTSRDFAYWLQGYFEVSGNEEVSEKEVAIIKEHLNLVFNENIQTPAGVRQDGVTIGMGTQFMDVNVSC